MLSAYAQEITGSISGVATDTTGAAVAGVKITVTNTGTNVSRVVATGPAGAYRVPFLIFGTYSVTGELQGFKTSRVQNVMLSTSEEARVDLTMAVGDVTETVTVSGSEALLKTEEATIGAAEIILSTVSVDPRIRDDQSIFSEVIEEYSGLTDQRLALDF